MSKMLAIHTPGLYALLAKLYPPPAYSMLSEVADATGTRCSGWCDCMVMSCWPSNGIWLHGMELKASRTDWQKERVNPAKSAKFIEFCHYWTLVTSPGVVADIAEIPENWGWLEAEPGKLKTRKSPPRLTPKPPDGNFLAAIFRKVGSLCPQGMIAVADFEAEVRARIEKRDTDSSAGVAVMHKEMERIREQLRQHEAGNRAFEQMTGIDLARQWRWDAVEVADYQKAAAVLKAITANVAEGHVKTLARLMSASLEISQKIALILKDAPGGVEALKAVNP